MDENGLLSAYKGLKQATASGLLKVSAGLLSAYKGLKPNDSLCLSAVDCGLLSAYKGLKRVCQNHLKDAVFEFIKCL